MMRMIRIIGLIIFAVLMSYSANALYKMHKSGALYEQYNSSRKSNITLFAASAVAFIVISGYEIRRSRKPFTPYQEYMPRTRSSGRAGKNEQVNTSCIYAGRESVDSLPNRMTPGFMTEMEEPKATRPELWMKVLKIICLVVTLVDLLLISFFYTGNFESSEGPWLFPSLIALFAIIGLLTAVGVFRQRPWGLFWGYLLAIINLILFPIGTAMALFLLMCLVGAAPVLGRKRKRKRRRA